LAIFDGESREKTMRKGRKDENIWNREQRKKAQQSEQTEWMNKKEVSKY
jgi:hypothetical protein